MNAYQTVAKRDAREPDAAPIEGDHAKGIENDRDLLDALQMADPEAAMFLGKSRQALNTQLGSKKDAKRKAPSDYFKLSDILILVSAARQMGRTFDIRAVRDYVMSSRQPHDESWAGPFTLLMSLLNEQLAELDTTDADTVVLILPTLNDLLVNQPEVAQTLKDMVKDLARRRPPVPVFLLASTMIRAKTAGQWFGITEDHCFGRDLVDHYLPSVIVYRREVERHASGPGDDPEDEARPYVLTEKGGFVAAPNFTGQMIAECVRSMMPGEMRSALQPLAKSKPPATVTVEREEETLDD